MELLTLGTVLKLKKSEQKIMIIARTPLFNREGAIGYFDYSACMYPVGMIGEAIIYFNKEDIEEICFEGYVDEQETEFQKIMQEEIKKTEYPKLQVE